MTIRGRILWPTVVQYAFMSPGIAVNILGNGYRLTSVSGTTRFARTEVILLKPNTRYPFSVQVDFAVQPEDSNVGLIWVFCLNIILTGATSESADFTIYNIQILEGAYTADTLPPYEPNRSAAIPIPYILHGIPDGEGGWAARDQLIMDRAGQTVIVTRRIDGEKLDPIRSIKTIPNNTCSPLPPWRTSQVQKPGGGFYRR